MDKPKMMLKGNKLVLKEDDKTIEITITIKLSK